MESLLIDAQAPRPRRAVRGPLRVLGMLGGAVASLAMLAVAALVAVMFAAGVVVMAVMAAVLLSLTALGLRRRPAPVRTRDGAQLLEARRTGGHSWVAYGWDAR